MRGSFRFAAVAAAMLVFATPVPVTAQTAVDLQLVLAVDASGSVDQVRFDLQKRGYVAAFRHARVLQAIRSGPHQAIAVTMVQWTGPMMQVQVAEWSAVGDERTAAAFAAAIERVPRQLFGGGTSISGAIDHATTLFPRSPFRGSRRVIDVSGDGSNNRGRPVTLARDEAVAAGIGINGLPILALEPDHGPRAELRDLRRRHPEEAHYRDRRQRTVARGPPAATQDLEPPARVPPGTLPDRRCCLVD
jgi:hypothetical protein